MHQHVLKELQQSRDLAHLLRGRRPSRRRRMPRQQQPDSIRLGYFGELRSLMQSAKRLVDHRLVPRLADIVSHAAAQRGDDEKKLYRTPGVTSLEVNEVVHEISADFNAQLTAPRLSTIASRYAVATSSFQREQLGRQLRAGVGVDVAIRDGKLGLQVQQFTARNVALIRSIPQRYFSQVESKVLADVELGKRWEQIADDLEERYEVSESTAKLIARDQVGKLYGSLNESRQTELGITRFTWETMQDNRVREAHAHLQGKSYDWDDPPDEETGEPAGDEGVIPGEPVNCRCYGAPDLTSVLESLA